MDARVGLVVASAPIGLLAGALIWLVFGGPGAEERRLEALATALGRGPAASHAQALSNGHLAAGLAGKSIFVVDAGASADMAIRLVGVSITPRGRSALIAFEGDAPQWLGVGDEHKGLILSRIGASEVDFDAPFGVRTVGMNDVSQTPASASAARPTLQSTPTGRP